VSGDNLIGHTDRGSLTAEAGIVHRGRSTLVIEVKVVDDRQPLSAKLVATQLAPVAPTVTAPAVRPGR
jgi:acyl-coenzyme A thioesterase PaaI-like protein